MPNVRENLIDWLRDAYAMEVQSTQMMENTLSRLKSYPQFESRLRQHVEETKRQADQLRDCLKQLGTDTSALKTTVSGFTGMMQAFSGIPAADEVVKAGIFSYAFEQWEIANYNVLIDTAEVAGEPQIRSTLVGILRQEEQMAEWFSQNLPKVLHQYLATGEKR